LSGEYDVFMIRGQRNENSYTREGIPMSICFSGLDTPCYVHPVTIDVSPTHPLMQLAHVIPWQALTDMVLHDLKRTTAKGQSQWACFTTHPPVLTNRCRTLVSHRF
jgi:hypothetical protein